MEYDFLRAVALLMVFEGVMPFLSPNSFKRNMLKMLQVPNQNLRIFGLVFMLLGLGLLYWTRS